MQHSPLLRLPVELLRDVSDYLALQDKAHLAATSRRLATVIKPPTTDEFLAAEKDSWATSRNLYTCTGCIRFRHLLQFTDEMRKGKRGRHGSSASARICIKCGVDRQLYRLGMQIRIMGQPHAVCKLCGLFTDRAQSLGAWNPCFQSPEAVHQRNNDRKVRYDYYEHTDDWACFVRSHASGKYSEELYDLHSEL
jgi:hypothetical protein